MGILNFKTYMIYFGSQEKVTVYNLPEKKDFDKLPNKYKFIKNGVYYRVNTSIINDDIWIHIEYGNPKPRPKTIINILDDSEKDNQRGEDEVELSSQIFFLYSFKFHTLYLSDSRRKTMLSDFLKEILNVDVHFKYYFEIEKFLSILKSINSISFTCEKNLFSSDNKLLSAYEDLTGASSPKKLEIKTSYSSKMEINSIKPFIERLFEEKDKSNLNRLIIRGVSDDNFDMIYNTDTVTESLSIKVERNEEGKYNDIKVRNILLGTIYSNYYE